LQKAREGRSLKGAARALIDGGIIYVGALDAVAGKDILDLGYSVGGASVALALQGASSVTATTSHARGSRSHDVSRARAT